MLTMPTSAQNTVVTVPRTAPVRCSTTSAQRSNSPAASFTVVPTLPTRKLAFGPPGHVAPSVSGVRRRYVPSAIRTMPFSRYSRCSVWRGPTRSTFVGLIRRVRSMSTPVVPLTRSLVL
jgi:hypothetical protein